MPVLALIDYQSGNLHSAQKALEAAARHHHMSFHVRMTADPEVIARADRLVLPGVGAFADCHRGIMAISGLKEAIEEAVLKKGRPFLGICVGMQLMATRGLEHEITKGLDWMAGEVVPLSPSDPHLKIPHMGWNTLYFGQKHPLLQGLTEGDQGAHAYFVHSYHMKPQHPDHILARTEYGGPLAAIVAKDTYVGTQFHPEKSQRTGLTLLSNFLRWRP